MAILEVTPEVEGMDKAINVISDNITMKLGGMLNVWKSFLVDKSVIATYCDDNAPIAVTISHRKLTELKGRFAMGTAGIPDPKQIDDLLIFTVQSDPNSGEPLYMAHAIPITGELMEVMSSYGQLLPSSTGQTMSQLRVNFTIEDNFLRTRVAFPGIDTYSLEPLFDLEDVQFSNPRIPDLAFHFRQRESATYLQLPALRISDEIAESIRYWQKRSRAA
jgi:hypothetical protein